MPTADLDYFDLYTDGACLGNPGPGGWAAILYGPGEPGRWLAGRDPKTTNNRMEIMGVIRGLERVPRAAQVVVHSDSQYVINTFTKNWKTNANLDLWDRLKRLVAERKVRWEWVRGHNGDLLNEQADRLATGAAADAAWGDMREGPLQSTNEGPAVDVAPPDAQLGLEVPLEGKAQPAGSAVPAAQAAVAAAASPSLPREGLGEGQGLKGSGVPESQNLPAAALSHLDAEGRARMVDVSDKAVTVREATAKGAIYMRPATLALIQSGEVAKGDVFTVAQVAGVLAAKRTGELIPLCHPLPLTHVEVQFESDANAGCVRLTATARTSAQTGVEMEALTAVSVAALTIYDMCKAADRGMRIADIRVVRKSGGKSGMFEQD